MMGALVVGALAVDDVGSVLETASLGILVEDRVGFCVCAMVQEVVVAVGVGAIAGGGMAVRDEKASQGGLEKEMFAAGVHPTVPLGGRGCPLLNLGAKAELWG